MAIGITWSLRWAVARTGHNYQCRCRGSLKFRRVFAVKPRPYVLYVTKFTSYMKQNYQNLMVRDYAYMFTATKPYQNSGDVLLAISDVLHAGVLLKTSYVRNTCTMGVSQVYKNACCTMLRITLSTDNTSAPTWWDWAMVVHFHKVVLVTHMKNDVHVKVLDWLTANMKDAVWWCTHSVNTIGWDDIVTNWHFSISVNSTTRIIKDLYSQNVCIPGLDAAAGWIK